jgi:omega-6 fatty acid desaturase (delta-12 desaturase)
MAAGLRPSDPSGALMVALTGMATVSGIALSASDFIALWLLGQIVFAAALLQWFVLLHEAGHHTLFRTRALNVAAGHLAGLFALIPFASWRRVHGLHHLWTGWQDLDPTTAALAPRDRSRFERLMVDAAWRTGLPLFSVVYRLSNYWNPLRLASLFTVPRQRRALLLNALVLAATYAVLLAMLGASEALRFSALALFLSLAIQDPLILSQHTHLPQQLSLGRKVEPLPPEKQALYTRSLRFPRWVSRWILFGFDAHELHHRFPAIPGHRLHHIVHTPANEVNWWTWLRAAKRLKGSVFLFQNSADTGFRE